MLEQLFSYFTEENLTEFFQRYSRSLQHFQRAMKVLVYGFLLLLLERLNRTACLSRNLASFPPY